MEGTGISVDLSTREDARCIINRFSRNETYLRSLISQYVPDVSDADVDSMSYSQLLHYGNVIRGVAEKFVKPSKKGAEPKGLESAVSAGEQLTLFR